MCNTAALAEPEPEWQRQWQWQHAATHVARPTLKRQIQLRLYLAHNAKIAAPRATRRMSDALVKDVAVAVAVPEAALGTL